MHWRKYEQSVSRDAVVFIHDTQRNGNVEGLLRGLPALLYSGFADATCPKSWLQLEEPARHQLYQYQWHLLQDLEEVTFDLIAATTQYYEDNLGVYSLRPLINRYSKSAHKIFVVGDREDFELSGTVRPLREDPVVDRVMTYEDVYEAFRERYEEFGVALPLSKTKNLFLHDNANLYEAATGNHISTVQELIDVLPDAPYLPIVQGLSTMFASPSGLGSEPLESTAALEALGRWLRRRIELEYREALSVARTINEYANTHERMFDQAGRKRMPAMNDARTARRALNPEDNPIHDRYYTWLSKSL